MRTVLWSICLILLLAATGCSDSSQPETELEARLSLSIVEYDSAWPLSVDFVLDATKSISPLCPVAFLEVRWDLDGDGTWDTEFERMHVRERGDLPALPYGVWTARCAVRDCAGNVSVAENSITLPEWMPLQPDLVVGDLIVNDHSVWTMVDMDPIPVGTAIRVLLPARVWGDNVARVTMPVRCFIDGEMVSEQECVVEGPYSPQSNMICPFEGLAVLEPGEHSIEVVLEVPEGVVDSDASNNRRLESRFFVGAAD